MTTFMSYLAHIDGAWFNPSSFNRIAGGVLPIEDFVWAFVYVLWIVLSYELLFERHLRPKAPSSRLQIYTAVSWSLMFVFIWCITVATPHIPYFYALLIALPTLALPWYFFHVHRTLIPKALATGVFFFPVSVLIEHVALAKNQWFFPGDHFIFIAQIGSYAIPLEEILWLMFMAPAIVAYYESWADDER